VIVQSVDAAVVILELLKDAIAAPPQPTDRPMLQEDQREEIDRLTEVAYGALVQAYQVAHGRLPARALAAEQERIRRGV
jgi:hypothetical protein